MSGCNVGLIVVLCVAFCCADSVANRAASDNTNCTTIQSDTKQTTVTLYDPSVFYCIPADTSMIVYSSDQDGVSLLVKYTYLHYGQCRENVKLTCTLSSTLIPSLWWDQLVPYNEHNHWVWDYFFSGTVSRQSFYMQKATSTQANHTLTQDELSLPVSYWTDSVLNVLLRGYGYTNSSTPIVKYNHVPTITHSHTVTSDFNTNCKIVQSEWIVASVGYGLWLLCLVPAIWSRKAYRNPCGTCQFLVSRLLFLGLLPYWIYVFASTFNSTAFRTLEYRVYNESIFNASSQFQFALNTLESDPRCVAPTMPPQTTYFIEYTCNFNMTNTHDHDPFNMEYQCGPLKGCTLSHTVDGSATDMHNRTHLFIEQDFLCEYDSCDMSWPTTRVVAPSVTMTGLNRTSISVGSVACTNTHEYWYKIVLMNPIVLLFVIVCVRWLLRVPYVPPQRQSAVRVPVVYSPPVRAPPVVYRPRSPPRTKTLKVTLIEATISEE